MSTYKAKKKNEEVTEMARYSSGRMGLDMKCSVKWWNDKKGYGFLTCTGAKPRDVFVHYSELVDFTPKSLDNVLWVEASVYEGAKHGTYQAKEVKKYVD